MATLADFDDVLEAEARERAARYVPLPPPGKEMDQDAEQDEDQDEE